MSFGLYLVLLQVGFALPTLLPVVAVRSYRTFSPSPRMHGGIFSVALAVSSHFPGVTWHSVLRSPDFPPITLGYQRSFSRLSPDILFMIASRSSSRRDLLHLFPLLMRHLNCCRSRMRRQSLPGLHAVESYLFRSYLSFGHGRRQAGTPNLSHCQSVGFGSALRFLAHQKKSQFHLCLNYP